MALFVEATQTDFTYVGIMEVLSSHFSPQPVKNSTSQLSARAQKRTESHTEFGHIVRKLAKWAYPYARDQIQARLTKERFVEGPHQIEGPEASHPEGCLGQSLHAAGQLGGRDSEGTSHWTLHCGRECSTHITLSFVPLFSMTFHSKNKTSSKVSSVWTYVGTRKREVYFFDVCIC